MLDLFCRRPVPPAGWKLGGSRHAWERDNAAVLSAYAELALSLERGACHRFGYVAGVWRWGKHSPRACARARVCGGGLCALAQLIVYRNAGRERGRPVLARRDAATASFTKSACFDRDRERRL